MTEKIKNEGLANAVLETMIEPLSKGKGKFYLGLAEIAGSTPAQTIRDFSTMEVNTEYLVAFAFNGGAVYGIGFDFTAGDTFKTHYHTAVEEIKRGEGELQVFSLEEDLITKEIGDYGIIVARPNPLLR